MNFIQTFFNGEQGLFKPDTLTPMQKMTLRFVVVGFLYYDCGPRGDDHAYLRGQTRSPCFTTNNYYAILTAHPLVGIFGSTYSIVFGAFLFLVPFLMKKPLWSIKLGKLDLRPDRRRDVHLLVLRIRFALRAALHALLAASRRISPSSASSAAPFLSSA